MTRPGPQRSDTVRAGRVAVVLVVTMALWLGAQNLGARMGWPAQVALALDFAALAAFGWTLLETYRIWRQRRDN